MTFIQVRRTQVAAVIKEGTLRDVKQLIDRKELATVRDEFGGTSMHDAVIEENSQIVRYLTESFPDTVNITDKVNEHYIP